MAARLLAWVVFGFLVLRMLPGLGQALHSLERASPGWLVGAFALEVLSEFGFVVSWRAIVDPDRLLEASGRGVRTASRAAWVQLGAGTLFPGGTVASLGAGAWIMRKLGMPRETIARRQFILSFLNTAIDALALIGCGLGLAAGLLSGSSDLMLTLVPALLTTAAVVAAVVVAPHASRWAGREQRFAKFVAAAGSAVEATGRIVRSESGVAAPAGALVYLWCDVLVLWTALSAVHSRPMPSFAVVVMAYIIGGFGGSIPLPAGLGTAGGIAGMLILYGTPHGAAVAAVVLYGAIELLVPLVGGAIAYVFLRRQFGPMPTLHGDEPYDVASLEEQAVS